MLDAMLKVQCMQCAATSAAAVIENLPDTLPLPTDEASAQPKNIPTVLLVNLLQAELVRIYYHWYAACLESPDWPTPKFTFDLSSLLGPLAGVLGGGTANTLLPLLSSLLGTVAPVIAENIPTAPKV